MGCEDINPIQYLAEQSIEQSMGMGISDGSGSLVGSSVMGSTSAAGSTSTAAVGSTSAAGCGPAAILEEDHCDGEMDETVERGVWNRLGLDVAPFCVQARDLWMGSVDGVCGWDLSGV